MQAELGEVPKPDGRANDRSAIALTQSDEAVQFVEETGIDTFALALDSVRGLKTKQISLDMDRHRIIRECVSVPLVLHGSSSMSDKDIKQGIAMGLCKVTVVTQLSQAFTGAVREVRSQDKELVDTRNYLAEGRSAQAEIVRKRIRVLGASGKAG